MLRIYILGLLLWINYPGCLATYTCPMGWADYGENCYRYSNVRYDFDTARKVCQNYGGDLLTYNTVDEKEFVEKMAFQKDFEAWIGLRSSDDENLAAENWHWTDGSTPGPQDPNITNWNCANLPATPCSDGQNIGPCGFMQASNGKWKNAACNNKKIFACKRSFSVWDNCDLSSGWHQYAGKCYKSVSELKSWSDARDDCVAMSGDLVTLKTSEEVEAFEHLQYCHDYQNAIWIGLSDTETDSENTVKWVDGSNLDSNTANWAAGQPSYDYSKGQNCAASYTIEGFQWKLTYCEESNRYMCSRDYGSCPEGWLKYDTGHCYLMVTAQEQKVTWVDAEALCKAHGDKAQLMKIENADEQDNAMGKMYEQLRASGNTVIRIGISDQFQDNQFRWSDDTQPNYQHWDDNRKEEVAGRMDCGFVDTTDNNPEARWGTHYCFDLEGYICRMPVFSNPQNQMQIPQVQPGVRANTCPDGWQLFEDVCFTFSDATLTYSAAKAECQSLGPNSFVARIDNSREQSFLSYHLRGKSWLGLVYTQHWEWDDGSGQTPSFQNWAVDGRNEQGTKNCALLQDQPIGQWYNAHCENEQYLVVCKQPATYVTDPPPTEAPNVTEPWDPECGPNWSYEPLSKRCYAVRTGVLTTWDTAHSLCLEEGADLVSIVGESEQLALNAILSGTQFGASVYWTGLNDRDLERGWQWTDGEPVPYFNWDDGEPNNAGGEEFCVELSVSNHYRWNDHRCSFEADGYICKKHAASVVVTQEPTTSTDAPLDCTPQALVSGTMYIADHDITAKSETEGREAYKARMNSGSSYEPLDHVQNQYITAAFPYQRAIDKVTIAGAQDADKYVTKFNIMYQVADNMFWQWVQNSEGQLYEFDGNTAGDKDAGVVRDLPSRIYATRVRILPVTWNDKISFRFEYHGCPIMEDRCELQESVSGEVRVLEDGMTANSWIEGHEPSKARIGGAGWEANAPYTSDDYLQLEFQTRMRLFEIQTKGHGSENRFVKKFYLQYYDPLSPLENKWYDYMEPHGTRKIFDANVNNNEMAYNTLHAELAATIVKIIPTEHEAGKALRVEFLGCSPGCHETRVISGESFRIPDSSLTASSYFDANHGPQRSRLHTERDGESVGGWCSASNSFNEWIKADLGQILQVRAISMQGREDHAQWVEKYNVEYSRDNNHWHEYKQQNDTEAKEFMNNYNQNEVRTNYFEPPFTARYVRAQPTAWKTHISLRWDISACPGSYSNEYLGCYADNKNDRDLPHSAIYFPDGGMSNELCSHHCYTQGYLFAGTQYGGECYCGNSYGRYGPSSQCTYDCHGNPRETCGGWHSNSIHSTGLQPSHLRCADGYEEYENSCYKFYFQKNTWGEAEFICNQEGAQLASIADQAENDFISSRLAQQTLNGWIGLHSLSQYQNFEWSNYDPMTFTNWARREPNNWSGQEDCVHMYYSTGYWNDESCETNKHGSFVCEKAKESIDEPLTSAAPDPGCGEGWHPYRWKCYIFVSTDASWKRHRTNCEGMGEGATLARIEDNQEQAFLASSVRDIGGVFWTDLNSQDNPGTYSWTDGSSPTYTHWAQGKPDKTTEDACVGLNNDDSGLWYDQNCDEAKHAICEKPSSTETRPTTVPTEPALGNCASGWAEFGDYCYIARVEDAMMRLSWDNARAWCQNHGADLVSIHSEQENQFLMTIKHPTKTINYWTGYTRATYNDSFKWSDGTEVQYVNWGPEDPSNGETHNCVQFTYGKGYWENEACSNTKSYFCKIHRGDDVIIPSTEAYPTPDPNGDCEPNGERWKFYNGYCYFFSDVDQQDDEYETWYDAGAWCNKKGGYLVSIHSEDEMKFIIGQTRFINSRWMWIGLNDISGGEQWSDNTAVEYVYWAPGEPNDNGGTEKCVASEVYRDRHGPWAHLHCMEKYSYVCKKLPGNGEIPQPVPTPAPGNCPEGYLGFLDKCFKFVDDEELSWQDAYEKCYADHQPYSLASIHYDEENAFLTAHLLDRPHTYWIGLEQFKDNQFGWIDNSQVTYTNWAPQEPNGGTSERCVHLEYNSQKAGQWNDIDCETTRRYICMMYKDESLPTQPNPEPGVCAPYGENAPYDYTEYNGDCFKAQGGFRTWQAAEDHCINDAPGKGHLASIRNVYEQSFMRTIFFDAEGNGVEKDEKVWIGLYDTKDPGQFAWTDTASVTYTNWGWNQPDRPEGGCVQYYFNDGTWFDEDCGGSFRAICRIIETEIKHTQPPHAENSTCPGSDIKDHNWLGFGSSCYLFMTNESLDFSEARHFCNIQGGELVSIHSEEENTFVYDHISVPGKNNQFWIGMYRSLSGWKWTDDTSVGYTSWHEGEPSDNGTMGENCVEMYTFNGKWNDIKCEPQNGFVCKTPSQIIITSTTPEPPIPTTTTHVSTIHTLPSSQGPTQPATTSSTTTTAATPPNVEEPDEKESLAPGAIVGIVFAVCALVLAVLFVLLVVYKRRAYINQDGLANPLYTETTPVRDSAVRQSTA